MNIRKLYLVLVLLTSFQTAHALISSEIGPLLAQGGFPWTQVATNCAVDDADLGIFEAVRQQSTANPLAPKFSYLTYKGANIKANGAPLVSRCNVDNILNGSGVIAFPSNGVFLDPQKSWNSLILTYQDPDGTGQNYAVIVNVYQVLRNSGTTSLIASFNSNSRTYTDVHEVFVRFNHAWDFYSRYYYVELQLIRKNTLANPSIHNLRLSNLFTIAG